MHELSITKNIFDIAQRYAEKNGASKVNSIFLRIGILRDLEPEWMQRYFRYVSKGTIAADAEILVTVEPAACKCNNCGLRFELNLKELTGDKILCPDCSVHDYELVSGMEFMIQGIEIS